jgi:small multidrug resistance family-3 protein
MVAGDRESGCIRWPAFVVGSLLWGIAFDGFTPDLYDLAGAVVCFVGVGLIMYEPR